MSAGAVPIDRFGNPIRGLIIAKRKVDEGNIMLVHPEGTRSMDGHLGEMKNGAAYIAIKSRVPILRCTSTAAMKCSTAT